MNLVVVSNRVARGKANEPMTGGLAAALLPVVENSGAIWVGSSGRVHPHAASEFGDGQDDGVAPTLARRQAQPRNPLVERRQRLAEPAGGGSL